MRFRHYLTIFIASLIAFASCSKSEHPNPTVDEGPNFEATIANYSATKAVDDKWAENDAIGIYSMKAGAEIEAAIDINKNYITTTGDGKFTPAAIDEQIIFPQIGGLDFIAYYPFSTEITGAKYAVDVTDQTSQPAIDFMYSDNAGGHSPSNPNVALTFEHKLTKIYLTINKEASVTAPLDELTATIPGMNTKGSVDLTDATLSAEESVAEIEALVTTSGESAIVEAIVMPATIEGAEVLFEIDGKTFVWKFTQELFEPGTKHTATITLTYKDEEPVAITVDSNIGDWVDIGHDDHEIDPKPIEGDGEKETPYIVSQLSDKVGESKKWISGYIVGSEQDITREGGDSETKENILIAERADETERANQVLVDLTTNPEIQARLNLVDHPELLQALVSVQGDIAEDEKGVVITAIIAEEGGKEPVDPALPGMTKIADIIMKYSVKDVIEEGTKITAVVISDLDGNNTSDKNIIVSDGRSPNSGIVIRTDEPHAYKAGSELEIDVSGSKFGEYNNLLQIELKEGAEITVVAENKVVEPIILKSLATLVDYQSMLISIEGSQIANTLGTMSGTKEVLTAEGRYALHTSSDATFANELVPTGNGTLTGIVSAYYTGAQVIVRNAADYEALTGARFGDIEFEEPGFSHFNLEIDKVNEDTFIEIPYHNAKGGESYDISVELSGSGVGGIAVDAVSTTFDEQGSGTIQLSVTGTPTTEGKVTFTINGIEGLEVNTLEVDVLPPSPWDVEESFEDIAVETSHHNGSYTTESGTVWNWINARTNVEVNERKSIMIGRNQKPQSYIETSAIEGGVGTLEFTYMQPHATKVNLKLYADGVEVAHITDSVQNVPKTVTVEINATNPVLKFIGNASSSGQCAIADVKWTHYSE